MRDAAKRSENKIMAGLDERARHARCSTRHEECHVTTKTGQYEFTTECGICGRSWVTVDKGDWHQPINTIGATVTDDRKASETIGERFLRREMWDCDECQKEFELGAAWFEQFSGICCPHCKSTRIGPRRNETVQ